MEDTELVANTGVSKETIDEVLREHKISQYQAMADNIGTFHPKITTSVLVRFFTDNYDELEATYERINRSRTQEKLAGK